MPGEVLQHQTSRGEVPHLSARVGGKSTPRVRGSRYDPARRQPVKAWGEEDTLPWKQKQRKEVEGKGRSSSPHRDAVARPWASG